MHMIFFIAAKGGLSRNRRHSGTTERNIGLEPEHIHGFIELVPVGDAEVIRLQQEEDYAYIR